MMSIDNTPDSPAKRPDGCTHRGGNYWTLFTPGIWKVFHAVSQACLPLELRLRGKSTRQSHGTPIFYVDLTVRTGMDMAESLQAANELDTQRQGAGFDQVALDEAARRGFGNGAFEDSEEDSGAVIEEFFSSTDAASTKTQSEALPPSPSSLAGKLEVLAAQTH